MAERFEAMKEIARQAAAAMAATKAATGPLSDDECEAMLVSTGARRLLTAIHELGNAFGVDLTEHLL